MGNAIRCNRSNVISEELVVNNAKYLEEVVCKLTDLNENEKKVVKLQNKYDVLLVKQKKKVYAMAPKCPHYGAPLVNGVLGNGRIRCQWHGACFNFETGDIEDYPTFGHLICHQVRIQNDDVIVRANLDDFAYEPKRQLPPTLCSNRMLATGSNGKRRKSSSSSSSSSSAAAAAAAIKSIVIVGGGPAAISCAETLRFANFTGSITMISNESALPYDRTKFSKILDFSVEKAAIKDHTFYSTYRIDFRAKSDVFAVEARKRLVRFRTSAGDETLEYDKLLLAIGSFARQLDMIRGHDSPDILTLKTYEDAQRINAKLEANKKVVVIGSSFIAMEIAASICTRCEKVTILSRSEVPFAKQFGGRVGRAIRNLFETKRIEFRQFETLEEFRVTDADENGSKRLTGVRIKSDTQTEIDCDLCVVAVGSYFRNDFLKGTGEGSASFQFESDGSISVNEHCSTSVGDVYAAGECAGGPIAIAGSSASAAAVRASIGHFGYAQYMGKIAALNMLGEKIRLNSVPYFWTSFFGKSIRYAGYGQFDDLVLHGLEGDGIAQPDDWQTIKFLACYLRDDRVIAMCSCNWDPIVSQFAEFVSRGGLLTKKDCLQPDTILAKLKF